MTDFLKPRQANSQQRRTLTVVFSAASEFCLSIQVQPAILNRLPARRIQHCRLGGLPFEPLQPELYSERVYARRKRPQFLVPKVEGHHPTMRFFLKPKTTTPSPSRLKLMSRLGTGVTK